MSEFEGNQNSQTHTSSHVFLVKTVLQFTKNWLPNFFGLAYKVARVYPNAH
jgi:hypothetical protein